MDAERSGAADIDDTVQGFASTEGDRDMATNGSLPPARSTLALSLIVSGAGILIQFLVGVPGFPKIPPGPIILGLAGILLLVLPRQRWPLIIGLIAALFVTVGGLIEGSVWGRLGDPGQVRRVERGLPAVDRSGDRPGQCRDRDPAGVRQEQDTGPALRRPDSLTEYAIVKGSVDPAPKSTPRLVGQSMVGQSLVGQSPVGQSPVGCRLISARSAPPARRSPRAGRGTGRRV
jgi:hypothetical protein